jgi:hypothetical protein
MGAAVREDGYLDWPTRLRVAVGVAYCLEHMHQLSPPEILRALDTSTICLTDDFAAKISDVFFCDEPRLPLSLSLSPPALSDRESVVYSYGMVLLETVSGRRNFDVSEETGRKKFSVWAYEEYERGNLAGIVDRRLPAEDLDMAQVERALQVSFWCIQEQPAQRPSMGKVVQMLEGVMELERPPPPKSSDSFLSTTTATSAGSGVSSSMVSTVVSSGAPVAPAPSPNLEQEMALGRSESARNRERVSRQLLSPQPYMTM